jgi:hypothetical protein
MRQQLNKADKLDLLEKYLYTVLKLIQEQKPVNFNQLCKDQNFYYSAGARSIRYILLNNLRLIESLPGGRYHTTAKYKEKYADHFGAFLRVVAKEVNNWKGRTGAPVKPLPKQKLVADEQAIINFPTQNHISTERINRAEKEIRDSQIDMAHAENKFIIHISEAHYRMIKHILKSVTKDASNPFQEMAAEILTTL